MDIIFYNILVAIICFIIGYLFGSFPSGVVIGNIVHKKDPRNFGSKNSGGTNVSRLWGFKIGALVYILDFAKLAIPLWSVWAILTFVNFGEKPLIPTAELMLSGNTADYLIQWPVYWLVILGCAIGHCWPVFAKFNGGKAAAVTYSSMLFSGWLTAIVSFSSFALTLKIKKYVSLSSIVGCLMGTLAAWLTCIPEVGKYTMYCSTFCPGWIYALILTLTSLILIYRHRSNIKRLINHEERKISWLG